jgi:hypothetical protein
LLTSPHLQQPLTQRASSPHPSVKPTHRSWLSFRPPLSHSPRFPPYQILKSPFALQRFASQLCPPQPLTQPARCPHRQMHLRKRCFPRTLAWTLTFLHRQAPLPLLPM